MDARDAAALVAAGVRAAALAKVPRRTLAAVAAAAIAASGRLLGAAGKAGLRAAGPAEAAPAAAAACAAGPPGPEVRAARAAARKRRKAAKLRRKKEDSNNVRDEHCKARDVVMLAGDAGAPGPRPPEAAVSSSTLAIPSTPLPAGRDDEPPVPPLRSEGDAGPHPPKRSALGSGAEAPPCEPEVGSVWPGAPAYFAMFPAPAKLLLRRLRAAGAPLSAVTSVVGAVADGRWRRWRARGAGAAHAELLGLFGEALTRDSG